MANEETKIDPNPLKTEVARLGYVVAILEKRIFALSNPGFGFSSPAPQESEGPSVGDDLHVIPELESLQERVTRLEALLLVHDGKGGFMMKPQPPADETKTPLIGPYGVITKPTERSHALVEDWKKNPEKYPSTPAPTEKEPVYDFVLSYDADQKVEFQDRQCVEIIYCDPRRLLYCKSIAPTPRREITAEKLWDLMTIGANIATPQPFQNTYEIQLCVPADTIPALASRINRFFSGQD